MVKSCNAPTPRWPGAPPHTWTLVTSDTCDLGSFLERSASCAPEPIDIRGSHLMLNVSPIRLYLTDTDPPKRSFIPPSIGGNHFLSVRPISFVIDLGLKQCKAKRS